MSKLYLQHIFILIRLMLTQAKNGWPTYPRTPRAKERVLRFVNSLRSSRWMPSWIRRSSSSSMELKPSSRPRCSASPPSPRFSAKISLLVVDICGLGFQRLRVAFCAEQATTVSFIATRILTRGDVGHQTTRLKAEEAPPCQ